MIRFLRARTPAEATLPRPGHTGPPPRPFHLRALAQKRMKYNRYALVMYECRHVPDVTPHHSRPSMELTSGRLSRSTPDVTTRRRAGGSIPRQTYDFGV